MGPSYGRGQRQETSLIGSGFERPNRYLLAVPVVSAVLTKSADFPTDELVPSDGGKQYASELERIMCNISVASTIHQKKRKYTTMTQPSYQ